MPVKSKTAVAAEYQADARRARSTGIALQSQGQDEDAEHQFAAQRYFEEKAAMALEGQGAASVALGEVLGDQGANVPNLWRPHDTLKHPDQVALDASAERTSLLLNPNLDVTALALDASASIDSQNSLEKMLAHQMALAHRMVFEVAQRAVAHPDPATQCRLANLSARLMDTFQGGLMTLQKLRTGNSQTVTVQHVQINGGQTVVAAALSTGGGVTRPGEAEQIEK